MQNHIVDILCSAAPPLGGTVWEKSALRQGGASKDHWKGKENQHP